MDTKRKNGQFIGAFAPYGYSKDPANKNNFIVDEEAAVVVRRIFDSYLNGISMCGIVRMLNGEGVACPAKYKRMTSTYRNAMLKRYHWTQEAIKRILTNPSYVGSMVQRRQEKINYKLEKFRKVERRNWIVVENTQDPIISPEEFSLVQELVQNRIIHYAKPEEAPHLLNGLLFCRDCGAKMTYRRSTSNKMAAMCMTYVKFGPSQCKSHRMSEKLIQDHVIGELKKIAAYTLTEDYYKRLDLKSLGIGTELKSDIEKRMKQTNWKLNEVREILKGLYADKIKGIIDGEMFLSLSGEYNAEKERLGREYANLANENADGRDRDGSVDSISIIRQISNFDRVDKVMLCQLIKRIEVSAEGQITISYKFKDPYIEQI